MYHIQAKVNTLTLTEDTQLVGKKRHLQHVTKKTYQFPYSTQTTNKTTLLGQILSNKYHY
jgi:hypothetical protein